MASDGAVEEIKRRLDIIEHIGGYVQLRRAGQNYKGLCPFHAEKTPSFMVNPQKQIFHCFGCHAGGDVIGFTMKHEGLAFSEALALLARKTGVELKHAGGYRKGEREALKSAITEALEYFRQSLKGSQMASDYIKKRGLSPETVEHFRLGFAPQGWHNLLNHLKMKRLPEEIILKAGLAAQGPRGAYDIFRSRLMFPIFDTHAEAIAFGGRVMDDSEPKYLNSPDTPLFHKSETLYGLSSAREAIRSEKFAAVVEGYLDVIACHQSGIRNVVAPLGTALTPGHLKKLLGQSDDLVLVFDGDAAGTAAARRSLGLVIEQNLRVKVLRLPEAEDPDSLIKKSGPDALRKLFSEAVSPVRFLVETTPGHKGVSEALEFLSKAEDPIFRDNMVVELSDLSRVSEQAIREKLSRFRRTGAHAAPRAKARQYTEETLLLSAAVLNPVVSAKALRRIHIDDLTDPLVKGLLGRMAALAEESDIKALDIAETDEERSLVTGLAIHPGFEPDDAGRVVEDCLKKILRRRMDREIDEAGRMGDLKRLNTLLAERRKLSQT